MSLAGVSDLFKGICSFKRTALLHAWPIRHRLYYPKWNAPVIAASISCTESIVLRVNYGADRFKVEAAKAAIARRKILLRQNAQAE